MSYKMTTLPSKRFDPLFWMVSYLELFCCVFSGPHLLSLSLCFLSSSSFCHYTRGTGLPTTPHQAMLAIDCKVVSLLYNKLRAEALHTRRPWVAMTRDLQDPAMAGRAGRKGGTVSGYPGPPKTGGSPSSRIPSPAAP
jgi:hypothetical protein